MLAEDGKSLTRIMLRETADLIVLDLMMPGEDGLSICRRLRAANDVTPVIMLTAMGSTTDRVQELHIKVIHILVQLIERVALGVE